MVGEGGGDDFVGEAGRAGGDGGGVKVVRVRLEAGWSSETLFVASSGLSESAPGEILAID